jgi:N-methylhydantoinase B
MAKRGDLFTLEIVRQKLLAIADEMLVVLTRTSMSPIVYEILDCSTGLTDARARVIAQTDTNLVFTSSFTPEVQWIIRKFGLSGMHPGDIFLTNIPYEGASHLTDMCVVKPIFTGGEVIGFGVAIAHWADVGGKVPGSLVPDATEIYQEGLQIPGIRVVRQGEVDQSVIDIIRANVRLPQHAMGDLNAGIAAVNIAEKRLEEVCARYSPEVVREAFEAILDYGERRTRAELAKIPNGVYQAEDFIDGDGLSEDPIPVRVTVTVKDDSMTVDFTGTSPQSRGPVNCTQPVAYGACKSVLKAITDPSLPTNDGCFRPLTVILPPGTVFSAVRPAPVSWYLEGFAFVIDLVWRALAPVVPEKLTAGNYLSCCAHVISGVDHRTGNLFVDMEGNAGGWGAAVDMDGESGLTPPTNGDFYNIPVEVIEAKLPLRIESYRLNTGTGTGAGKRRGGFGLVREYRILTDHAVVFSGCSGWQRRPWGTNGGRDGSNNFVEVLAANGYVCHGRISDAQVRRGDLVRVVTGCGGGSGDPLDREPELVLRDWRDGYITAEEAERDYGVVIDVASPSVDLAATRQRRALMPRSA